MRCRKTWVFAAAVLTCLITLTGPAFANSVLLLSSGSTQLDAQIQADLNSHGHFVAIGSNLRSFTGSGLAGHDVVVLLATLDSGDGNIPVTGQNALVEFVSNGGGLVTVEWTVWMSAFQSFQILKSIFPVVPNSGYSEIRGPITYTQATANPIINFGLPTSITFYPDDFYGTETVFAARPGATVFYTSAGAASGAGVVGWNSGAGRVIQFSSLFGSNQLQNPQSGLLLANAASWAGSRSSEVSKVGFDPALIRAGGSFVASFSGNDIDATTFLDLRFRAPQSGTDEIVLNWQQGPTGNHNVTRNSRLGTWIVTGVRPHRVSDDHNGAFYAVQADFTVIAAPLVTGLTFEPPTVTIGGNTTARFAGPDVATNTYFDVRFRAPGNTVESTALNWQQGAVSSHTILAGTSPGNWIVTGVRAHSSPDDHIGDFDPILASLGVLPSTCVVTTRGGDVYGQDLGASCAFLGIPYAAPPIGNLRWKPPQPAPAWAPAVFNAMVAPLTCSAVEDCLKLNIWIPKSLVNATAPVIVWLHTGAFVAASANFAGHNGRNLAEQYGVIVVAPNYRLGPFGFLAHPALTTEVSGYASSGNYGFLDQRAAMIWVRDNIAAFGGDTSRITIGGQSAGAHSVSLHVVSPGSSGLFQRAMMESGFASTRWRTREEAELQGTAFAAALGCLEPGSVVSCMRSKSTDLVLRALTNAREEFNEVPGARWSPVVDGLDIPDQPRELYARGAFSKVPMIFGVTRDEGWTFVDRSFPADVTAPQFEAALGREFGSDAAAFLARYRVEDFTTAKDGLAQVTGDAEFICEAVRLGRLVSRTGTPVYIYSFEYVVDGLASNRVIHGLGTNFIFGNDFVGANPAPHVLNAEDRILADAMGGYWARFAASGDPNAQITNAVQWLSFDGRSTPGTDRERYLRFDSVIQASVGLRKAQCDFLEPFFFRSVVGGVPASTP